MNKEWSELNKKIHQNLRKDNTFDLGIKSLLELRSHIKNTIIMLYNNCTIEDYFALPLKNDKTIAYYIWHMTRIEDITSNTLMNNTNQVFFDCGFDLSINSPIITTGNEIKRDQLEQFSKQLDMNELMKYFTIVYENTNLIIQSLKYTDLKTPIGVERKEKLLSYQVVSKDEDAFWLIDYWCNKNNLGLILMPFSRHLIMHIEGCIRIYNKLKLSKPNHTI